MTAIPTGALAAALLAVAMAMVAFDATPAAAEPVDGAVVDLDGRALADVAVELRDVGGATLAEAVTDADGRFAFARDGHEVVVADDAYRVSRADAGAGVELTALPPSVEVRRIAGADRVATAAAAAQYAFPDGTPHALLADAGDWPDALAAAPLAAQRGAPVLLAGPRLAGAADEAVATLRTETATVLGGVGAVPLVVQADSAAVGLAVDRIAGETRTDTAALAATAAFPEGAGAAIVAASAAFPDALAAGTLAAVADAPVLLTGPDRLDGDAAATLDTLAATSTVVVGGPAAVGDGVAGDLPDPRRLAGSERYATAASVAEAVVDAGGDPSTVVVATGRDFPDALTGSVVAGRGGHPLVLLDGDDPDGAAAGWAFLERHAAGIGRVLVMGGPAAVGDDVVAALAALETGGGDG